MGSYRDEQSIAQSIPLPDSLISRFDLVFMVKDANTADFDQRIADHVLKNHRYVCYI